MSYTLGQAARAVGRSKTTLNRAIKSGKLSAARGEDGSYTIDPAELHRVYPVTGSGNGQVVRSVTANGADPSPSAEPLALQQLLAERERLVEGQAEVIRNLWHRLDGEVEERRRLMALLTGPKVPWWRRWFRG